MSCSILHHAINSTYSEAYFRVTDKLVMVCRSRVRIFYVPEVCYFTRLKAYKMDCELRETRKTFACFLSLCPSRFAVKGRLYGRKWFTFGSPSSSKNEPGLKLFLALYDKKMYPFHKQTESRPELTFYYFFKFQKRVLQLQNFHSVLVWSRTPIIYMIFSVLLWLT